MSNMVMRRVHEDIESGLRKEASEQWRQSTASSPVTEGQLRVLTNLKCPISQRKEYVTSGQASEGITERLAQLRALIAEVRSPSPKFSARTRPASLINYCVKIGIDLAKVPWPD